MQGTTGEFSLVVRWNEQKVRVLYLIARAGPVSGFIWPLTAVIFAPEDLALSKVGRNLDGRR